MSPELWRIRVSILQPCASKPIEVPDLSRWKTAVTYVADSEIRYRGHSIEGLIADASVSEVIWLLIVGSTPTAQQSDAMRRAVIAAADHGLAAPSIVAARTVASTRVEVAAAMAAGLIAFAGPAHGGAAEAIAKLLVFHAGDSDLSNAATRLVAGELEAGRRVPGYGHPYHHRDPRVAPLLSTALESDRHRQLARAVERELIQRTGHPLNMNADAAVAAMLLDAGLEPSALAVVTALGRCIGLAAHVYEEVHREKPFRGPALDSIEFDGDPGGTQR